MSQPELHIEVANGTVGRPGSTRGGKAQDFIIFIYELQCGTTRGIDGCFRLHNMLLQ